MTANAWGENARLTELLWLCTADSGLSGFVGDDQAALGDRAGPTRWEPGQHGRYAKLIADQKTITRRRRPSRANLPAAGGGPAAAKGGRAAMGGDDGGDRPPSKFEQRQSRKSKIRFMGKVVVNLKNDRADKASIEALRGASFDATASQSGQQKGDSTSLRHLPTMDPKLLDSPRSPATPNAPSATPADEKVRSFSSRRPSDFSGDAWSPAFSAPALYAAFTPAILHRRLLQNYVAELDKTRSHNEAVIRRSSQGDSFDAAPGDSFAALSDALTRSSFEATSPGAEGRRDSANLRQIWADRGSGSSFVASSRMSETIDAIESPRARGDGRPAARLLRGHGASPDQGRERVARARCAVDAMRSCSTYDCGSGSSAVSLRLHCGLGVGIVNVFVVGADERWELVIAGDPIRQLAETEGEADRGQVVVSPEVQRLLSMGHVPYPVPLERTDGGNYQLRWAAEDDRPKDDKAFDDDAAPAEPEEKKKRRSGRR
ncbi:adenylate cyclase [Aureococcus anophagefferens]|nr:adenylate cyclase [Aureococcus anophagefferens]